MSSFEISCSIFVLCVRFLWLCLMFSFRVFGFYAPPSPCGTSCVNALIIFFNSSISVPFLVVMAESHSWICQTRVLICFTKATKVGITSITEPSLYLNSYNLFLFYKNFLYLSYFLRDDHLAETFPKKFSPHIFSQYFLPFTQEIAKAFSNINWIIKKQFRVLLFAFKKQNIILMKKSVFHSTLLLFSWKCYS